AMRNLASSAVAISGEPVSTPVEEEERVEFQTDGGRTVYGGGGITPDLTIYQDTLTTEEQEFRRTASRAGATPRNIVFRWAVEWSQNNDPAEGFSVTPEMRNAVYQKLVEAEAGVDRELFDASHNYVDWLIATELSGAEHGNVALLRSRAVRDAQVEVALELLQRADSPENLIALATEEAELRNAAGGATEGAEH
ncbi:MAG: hypothetical protein MJB57_04315, partial [Gemmatimonadetes bacterium]|nr:hypothetical protein [Gemmatimonadota bacterium]